VSVEAHHFQRGMICGETAQIHQRLSGIDWQRSAGGDKGQHSVHQKHYVPFDADKRRNSARVASGSKS
jgi:hypothetical protein